MSGEAELKNEESQAASERSRRQPGAQPSCPLRLELLPAATHAGPRTRSRSSLLRGSSTAFFCFTLLSCFFTLLRADWARMGCRSSDRTSFSPAPTGDHPTHRCGHPATTLSSAMSSDAVCYELRCLQPKQPARHLPGDLLCPAWRTRAPPEGGKKNLGKSPRPREALTFAADVELGHLHAGLRALGELLPAGKTNKTKEKR